MSAEPNNLHGAIAKFDSPAALVHAVEATRDAGYTKIDPHSPFPIHGMDDALGLGRSILPGFVLVGGLTGTASAVALCGWTSAIDYPIIIGGKSYFSIEAFVPIMFELTILFASFTSLFGMLILNRLPRLHHPVFESPTFQKYGTADGFFIVIEAIDPKFDPEGAKTFLAAIGGTDVELLEA